MKILVAIPSYSNPDVKHALDAIIDKPGIEILCCDNGATQEVKYILNDYQVRGKIKLWHNATNEYVNKPWCEFIKHFLTYSAADYLTIMNDDLVLGEDWDKVLKNRWEQNPNEIILPTIVGDLFKPAYTTVAPYIVATDGTPGIFVTMNKEQAQIAKDFPHQECKLWFMDEFYFRAARALGYETIIPENFIAKHGWSRTMDSLPGKSALVEQDKKAWKEIVEPIMYDTITRLKK